LLSFPLDSPLARALTGVELLYTKASEWEKNAHRGVSLAEHMDMILKLVRRWRKLEADTWKALLRARCERQVQTSGGKWFPWLFSLCVEGVQEADGSVRPITPSEVFETIESFIQVRTG
jgi:midasin (ATPase involved in ribosome maturation)